MQTVEQPDRSGMPSNNDIADNAVKPFASDAALCAVASCEQLVAAGDLTAAKQQLLSLEAVAPRSEQEWKRLHSLCLSLNDRTRAQVYTERFLATYKGNAAAHLANARNFMAVYGDRIRAQQSVAEAMKSPTSDARFWREVAEIQNVIRDHEGVCDTARRSLSFDPSDVDLRELLISSLGVLELKREIRKECALLSHILLQSNNEDPLRWARLARIAAGAGAKKQAKEYIDLAIEYLSGVNYGADFELIRALILTDQSKRAMTQLKSLMNENSQNRWLWETLIETAMSGQCYDIALIAIDCLKAIPCHDPEVLYRLSLMEKEVSKLRGKYSNGIVRRLTWLCNWRS
jgi:tetratricopeptide (TPR) repeat protein